MCHKTFLIVYSNILHWLKIHSFFFSFFFTNQCWTMYFPLQAWDPDIKPEIHHQELHSSLNQGQGPSLTLFWTCSYLSSADSSLRLMSPHPLCRPADGAPQMCSLTLNNGSMWPLTYESTHLLDTLLHTCLTNLDCPCCTLGLSSVDLCSSWKQSWGTCVTQTAPAGRKLTAELCRLTCLAQQAHHTVLRLSAAQWAPAAANPTRSNVKHLNVIKERDISCICTAVCVTH